MLYYVVPRRFERGLFQKETLRLPTYITLTGDAEKQAKDLQAKLGGSLPQNVRQAIKFYHDYHFPPPPPTGTPPPPPTGKG